MIIGFDHTSFTVADIHKTVDFWTKHLGFETASLSPRQGDWQETVTGVKGANTATIDGWWKTWRNEICAGQRNPLGYADDRTGTARKASIIDSWTRRWVW